MAESLTLRGVQMFSMKVGTLPSGLGFQGFLVLFPDNPIFNYICFANNNLGMKSKTSITT